MQFEVINCCPCPACIPVRHGFRHAAVVPHSYVDNGSPGAALSLEFLLCGGPGAGSRTPYCRDVMLADVTLVCKCGECNKWVVTGWRLELCILIGLRGDQQRAARVSAEVLRRDLTKTPPPAAGQRRAGTSIQVHATVVGWDRIWHGYSSEKHLR